MPCADSDQSVRSARYSKRTHGEATLGSLIDDTGRTMRPFQPFTRVFIVVAVPICFCLFPKLMPNKPTWLSNTFPPTTQNRPCQDKEMPQISPQINPNHLTTTPSWFSHSRQKAHEMSSSSRVGILERGLFATQSDRFFRTRDNQGFARRGSRNPRLGIRLSRPRTREDCRIAREGGQLHHRNRESTRQVLAPPKILCWYALYRADHPSPFPRPVLRLLTRQKNKRGQCCSTSSTASDPRSLLWVS